MEIKTAGLPASSHRFKRVSFQLHCHDSRQCFWCRMLCAAALWASARGFGLMPRKLMTFPWSCLTAGPVKTSIRLLSSFSSPFHHKLFFVQFFREQFHHANCYGLMFHTLAWCLSSCAGCKTQYSWKKTKQRFSSDPGCAQLIFIPSHVSSLTKLLSDPRSVHRVCLSHWWD